MNPLATLAALSLLAVPVLTLEADAERATQEAYESSAQWGCADLTDIRASSTLKPEGKYRYDVKQLADGQLATGWVEGKKGLGEGEWVEFTFKSLQSDHGEYSGTFHFFNGLHASPALWKANSRVARLEVLLNGKRVAEVVPKDAMGLQSIRLADVAGAGKVKPGDVVRFVIARATRGTKYEDTVIAELVPTCTP